LENMHMSNDCHHHSRTQKRRHRLSPQRKISSRPSHIPDKNFISNFYFLSLWTFLSNFLIDRIFHSYILKPHNQESSDQNEALLSAFRAGPRS
jgi:hypothetical protein